ncbi:MAG: M23 family metallopeptidase [Spirochaetia bacterium]|nr:M23 family metallopeptidase [Spirochaetia bacterium]
MKLFDKILIGTGVISIYSAAMIFFSGELNSEIYPYSANNNHNKIMKAPEQKSAEVVVYDKEVDEIIQAYFKNIRENPDKLEEEDRLINETDKHPDKGSNAKNSGEKTLNQEDESVQMHKYTVSEGDSLWRISQKYNIPVYTIISANPEKDKEMIRPGDSLDIPDRPGIFYEVKSGDSVSALAKKYKMSSRSIIKTNHLPNEKIRKGEKLFLPEARPLEEFRYVVKSRFIWPVSGKITSGYGMRKHPFNSSMQFHTGIDIGANIGEKIHAAADGVVVYAGDGGTYGNMVILRHKDGYISVYAHASSVVISKGQFIKQGQEIARVGITGVTTGPHLHFEIKKFNNGINPFTALHEKVKLKVPVNT